MKRVLLTVLTATLLASCGSDKNPNAIPGLTPYDITKNFEDNGFTFEKTSSSDFGTSHVGTQIGNDYTYTISTFGNDYKSLENVTASVLIKENKSIELGKQFFAFTATLPYDGSNPTEAAKWVQRNYDNDKQDTIIGGVKFTITAPTKFSRTLLLEKEK